MTTTITPGCFDEYDDGHTTHDAECHLCLDAKQDAISALIRQHLGYNIGCNADWCVSAWHLYIDGQDRYLLDMEDDTYSVVTREYDEDNDIITTLETFHVDRLAAWLKTYSNNLFLAHLDQFESLA